MPAAVCLGSFPSAVCGLPAETTTTMSLYIYNNAFVYSPNFGYSVLMSYVIVLMVAAIAFVQFKLTREK